MNHVRWSITLLSSIVVLLIAPKAGAHCDTLDGPVAKAVQAAMDAGNPTAVLRWVAQDQEKEVKDAFASMLAVRGLNEQARQLADRYFLETVVRLHRQSEGVPYTGLKEGGEESPAVKAADEALDKGSAEPLIQLVLSAVEKSLRQSFREASEARKDSEENVEAGRHFVRAYVTFIHLADGIYQSATSLEKHEEKTEHEH